MGCGKAAKRVAFSLIPLIVLIGICEMGLRVGGLDRSPIPSSDFVGGKYGIAQADEDLFWSLPPAITRQWGEITVTTNHLGLRSPEIGEKRPGEFRILCLGESSTFGVKVENNQTYSSLLQTRLNDYYHTKRFTVINAGVSAYSSFQSLTYLKLRGLKLKPDLVLWYHEINDFFPTAVRDSHNNVIGMSMTDKEYYESRRQGLHRKLLAWSATYRFLAFQYAYYQITHFKKDETKAPAPWLRLGGFDGVRPDLNYPQRVGFVERQSILDELVSVCRQQQVQLVMIHPSYHNVPRHQCQLTRICNDQRIPMIEAYEVLHPEGSNADNFFFADNTHPNALGHQLLADAIAKFLEEQVFPGSVTRTSVAVADDRFTGMSAAERAIARYGQALRVNPCDAILHVKLAIALKDRGQGDEAIAHFEKALASKPDCAEAYYHLGSAALRHGELDKAIANYSKALDIKADYAEAHNALGSVLLERGQTAAAIAQLQKAVDIKADDAQACNDLGIALTSRGQSDAGVAHYRRAVELDPSNLVFRTNLGNALIACGKVDDGIAQYRKVLENNPDQAQAQYSVGDSMREWGHADIAIAHLRIALELNLNSAYAHNSMGLALADQRRVDEAIAHYLKALEITPNNQYAHNNLGWALTRLGRVDEAMAHYRKALEIDSDFALAHNNLGIALAGRGQVDEALSHFQKALNIDPSYAMAHNNLGFALAGRGQMDEAIDHYRKALEIDPGLVLAHKNLGDALADRGRLGEAIVHYKKVLEITPADTEARRKLNVLLAQRVSGRP
jgi:tetratricopeptide (TPR) repeat protein